MSEDNWFNRQGKMICATCIFFVEKVNAVPVKEVELKFHGKVGRCRRHSPTLQGFPVVFDSDWCGDHKLDEAK